MSANNTGGPMPCASDRYLFVAQTIFHHIIESAVRDIYQIAGDVARFTPEPLTDPDAEWVDAIIEADNPEVARTLIATIRGEQS